MGTLALGGPAWPEHIVAHRKIGQPDVQSRGAQGLWNRAVPLAVVHQHGSWIDHTETLSTRRSRTRDRKYGETRAASGSSRPASSTQAGVVDTERDPHPVADLQLVEEPPD